MSPRNSVPAALARVLSKNTGPLVVVTGAGISLPSGIPTFRGSDPDAVWAKDVRELGTFRYFQQNTVGSWLWYTSRFDVVFGKQPNPAHLALAEIERWQQARGQEFLLVTQNVDCLHEAAGSKNLVKVHGSADRVRCVQDDICGNAAPNGSLPRTGVDIEKFKAKPSPETLPKCPSCGSAIRQHVLWFDEFYTDHADYQWERVLAASASMKLLMFVGTSFSVGVTGHFAQTAIERGTPSFAIDPAMERGELHPNIVLLRERAEELLPAVCHHLGLPTSKM